MNVGQSNGTSNNGSDGPTLRCFVSKWHAVARWDWDFNEDTCAVCQFALSECCPKCTIPGASCPPVQGRCSHVFHQHCIQPLDKCPLCRADWVPLIDPCSAPATNESQPLSLFGQNPLS